MGASVHGEKRSGLAAKREGVKHSVAQKVTELRGKAHPQSQSTSSIGRAIVTETVGRRFKSGVFIPSERLSLPRLESAVILGPAKGTEATVNSQGDRMSVRCQSGSGVSCPCLYRDLAE